MILLAAGYSEDVVLIVLLLSLLFLLNRILFSLIKIINNFWSSFEVKLSLISVMNFFIKLFLLKLRFISNLMDLTECFHKNTLPVSILVLYI